MKRCLIIGAGQLGSRHLQGLVKYKGHLEIYVLDSSLDSIKAAQDRENEIEHKHKVIYTQVWDTLPNIFDLVIVATNANIRESIINKFLQHCSVNFLVLEKVLFQELDAYQRVNDLLLKNNVNTYVNHSRRLFETYASIKTKLKGSTQHVFSIVGGNWGLGCNALHFLDLFVYLCGKKIKDICTDSVDEVLIESTRKGFTEFTGTLTGHLEDNSFFSITSFDGAPSGITVTVFNNEQRFIIQEGGTPMVYSLEKDNQFMQELESFRIQYQSELTTNMAIQLLDNNFCSLPSYDESRHTHELFLSVMLAKHNRITGLQSTILPIT